MASFGLSSDGNLWLLRHLPWRDCANSKPPVKSSQMDRVTILDAQLSVQNECCNNLPMNFRIINRTMDQKRAPILAMKVDALRVRESSGSTNHSGNNLYSAYISFHEIRAAYAYYTYIYICVCHIWYICVHVCVCLSVCNDAWTTYGQVLSHSWSILHS